MTDDKTHLSRAGRIETALAARFTSGSISLVDESSLHAGHAGARPGGETHYRLRIVSDEFAGLSRVARQRLVYDLLHEEFDTGLHALALELKTPEEAKAS
ncbi:MAG TPA: BolA family protein [Vitreimonas sp.]|nr:BolA family protein [Vitreimonas sp.]